MALNKLAAWGDVPGGAAPTREQAAAWARAPEAERAIREYGVVELLAHADGAGSHHWSKGVKCVDVALVTYPTWDEWGRPVPESSEWRTMTLIRVLEVDSPPGGYECARFYRVDVVTDSQKAQQVADVFALEIDAVGRVLSALDV